MALSRRDRAAMRASIAVAKRESKWRDRVEEKFKTEGFEAAGRLAASYAQYAALKLKPWQVPPADIADGVSPHPYAGNTPAEVNLRKRMAALRISYFVPDPVAAIEAAEAARARKRPASQE
jgi:hypothetical protein